MMMSPNQKRAGVGYEGGVCVCSSSSGMILPQLEAGTHGVEVVGMFFFDDNVYILRQGDAVGERLARLARAKDILLDDV